MVMRMALTVVAKEAVEAALEGFAGIAWFSEAPFPKATANVAKVAEKFTQKRGVCWDGHLLIKANILVVAYRRVSRVEAGHEDAA